VATDKTSKNLNKPQPRTLVGGAASMIDLSSLAITRPGKVAQLQEMGACLSKPTATPPN